MEAKKRQLALQATPEEQEKFELIKQYHRRYSDSDMLRILIEQEHEKILSKNISLRDNFKQEPARA